MIDISILCFSSKRVCESQDILIDILLYNKDNNLTQNQFIIED